MSDENLTNVAPFASHPEPLARCPKCQEPQYPGSIYTSQWGVTFERRKGYPTEVLVWTCRTCGYDIRTFPADQS